MLIATPPQHQPASGPGRMRADTTGECLPPFIHESSRCRVIFGFGTRDRLGPELAVLGMRRAMIVATSQQGENAQVLAAGLGGRAAGVFAEAAMHTPVNVTARAIDALRGWDADVVVSLGGGSSIGLGKAVSSATGVPHVAMPTTYAGSEATPILGETRNGVKTTRCEASLLPSMIIYDVDLTLTLPPALSATSGMNAVAHAAEALYAREASPLALMMGEASIAALARALPAIVADPLDRAARADALYGAWLAGSCLGMVGMALHHKLCHVLGGMFELPHSETHAVLLPHTMAYNAAAAPDAMMRIARALGTPEATLGLAALNERLGIPPSLAEIGMTAEGIEPAAAAAVRDPYWNPRPIEEEPVRDLLRRAYAGARPAAPA